MSEQSRTGIPTVKVVSNSMLARHTKISVGGVPIPCTYAKVEFRPDELVTLSIETRADLVDVDLLQSQTEVVVKQEPSDGANKTQMTGKEFYDRFLDEFLKVPTEDYNSYIDLGRVFCNAAKKAAGIENEDN